MSKINDGKTCLLINDPQYFSSCNFTKNKIEVNKPTLKVYPSMV